MTPEEYRRVREVYDMARSLTGDERDAYLRQECAGQASLRRDIERLMQARERIPAWLDQPMLGEAGRFAGTLPRIEGRQIGGYTVLREIGRGGMGCVYLAQRSDGAFSRQVAVKVMLPSAKPEEMLARFQREREILASLDHPNIARLIDAGATDDGWPYFAMEYVEGQPISDWCDAHRLNISRRLELFKGVTAAVRYAHERSVVHRDLKPANILVTRDGAVKVLDFGIAKLIASDAGYPVDTATLAARMTPEYASPEQLTGALITTRSDVYSLGVVLYELLTGHRPYLLRSASLQEIARIIAEIEPALPSEMVSASEPVLGRDGLQITPEQVSELREGTPGRLRMRLAGDLDAILMTALRREPERRYPSVDALAGDLERHLEHRPIEARPATLWCRVQRFRRRSPGAIVAAALVAIPIIAGLAAATLQTRRELAATRSLEDGGAAFFIVGIGITLVGLGVAVYLARPSRRESLAALAGGAIWSAFTFAKVSIGSLSGWWRSRMSSLADPMQPFGPYTWILITLGLTAVMFLLSWIHKRFGWKGVLVFLPVFSLYQVTRERFWFSIIIPLITYQPGWTPVLTEAFIFGMGGLMALLVMRRIRSKV